MFEMRRSSSTARGKMLCYHPIHISKYSGWVLVVFVLCLCECVVQQMTRSHFKRTSTSRVITRTHWLHIYTQCIHTHTDSRYTRNHIRRMPEQCKNTLISLATRQLLSAYTAVVVALWTKHTQHTCGTCDRTRRNDAHTQYQWSIRSDYGKACTHRCANIGAHIVRMTMMTTSMILMIIIAVAAFNFQCFVVIVFVCSHTLFLLHKHSACVCVLWVFTIVACDNCGFSLAARHTRY